MAALKTLTLAGLLVLSAGAQADALREEEMATCPAGEISTWPDGRDRPASATDVLSYYDDGKGNRCFSRSPDASRPGIDYRSTMPTACDIARCRQVNSLTP